METLVAAVTIAAALTVVVVSIRRRQPRLKAWWSPLPDSNRRPPVYKTGALAN